MSRNKSHYSDHPDEMSWQIRFKKKKKKKTGGSEIDTEVRGGPKRHCACLAGREAQRGFQGQLQARSRRRPVRRPGSPRPFKKQDLLARRRTGRLVASRRLITSPPQPHAAPAGVPAVQQSRAAPQQGPLWSSRPQRLQGAGPWGGGDAEGPSGAGGRGGWVTGPAESGSSRSPRTGPHYYCSCGAPWSRTRRAMRATPAPGRWGR